MLVAFWLNYLLCLWLFMISLQSLYKQVQCASMHLPCLVSWCQSQTELSSPIRRTSKEHPPKRPSERMRRILKAIGDLERKGSGFRERRSSCGIKEKEVDHVPQVAEIWAHAGKLERWLLFTNSRLRPLRLLPLGRRATYTWAL